MSQITPHFRLSEFSVSGSYPHLAEPIPTAFIPNAEKLARTVLEPMRVEWGRPFQILSGYRAPALNKAVGGSPTSQHATAAAADITTADVRMLFLLLLRHPDKYPMGQCIWYGTDRAFLHIALPSRRYPTPTFFVSPSSKKYVQVKTVGEALGAGA